MVFHYDHFDVMFLMHPDMVLAKFLATAGATKGYAKDMFERMYQALTAEMVDVEEEYELFYSKEYGNLYEYLDRRYNLSNEQLEQLDKTYQENPDVCLYRVLERSYHGSSLRTFMFEDPMVDRITKILLMK